MGIEASRNENWVRVAVRYTEDLFTMVVLLRMFPWYLHQVAARLLPSYWRMQTYIGTAKRIVGQVVRDRRALEATGGTRPDDVPSWIMDKASTDKEKRADELGNRTLTLAIASIRATCTATLHTLHDVIARPDYLEPIRQDIISVLRGESVEGKRPP